MVREGEGDVKLLGCPKGNVANTLKGVSLSGLSLVTPISQPPLSTAH